YVSKSDELILDQVKNDYLSLTKIPKTNLEAKVAADITLSESAHKVDLQTNKGIITLNLLKEDEKWVVFLNLKQIYKISQLLEQLKDAELRENEFDLLAIYQQLNEILPSSLYQEKIKMLTEYIENQKQKNE